MLHICSSCSKCCIGTDIRLLESDIDRWKEQSRLDILLSINPLLGESRQLIKKKNSDECVFLQDDKSCKIHETKPEICRRFPSSLKQAELFECKLTNLVFTNKLNKV